MLLENPLQVAKSAMCTFCLRHLNMSLTRIRPQVRHHPLHRDVPCDSLVGQKHAINGEMQQTGHIIKCHCHLPKWKVETRSLLMPPLHKGTNQTMVNHVVACILKPTKTSALHTVTPPTCSHYRGGFFVMHHLYLLSVVDAF